jgi:hypothetical protein
MNKIRIPDNPKDFYDIIPKDVMENIEFRVQLNKMLSTDKKAQDVFMEICRQYIPNFFSAIAWTYNPWSRVNYPFILRPMQIPTVETLDWCIEKGHDAGINKSREEGASEICCKLFAAKTLLHEYTNFIVGSRKKELVDNFGDYYTLYAKIDNVFSCLPTWWKERSGYDPKNNRKDMLLTIPCNNSSIVGETTNESFSAGSRATALLLDEFGRVDATTATAIEGSVHDVSPCIIYSSTHWLGAGHQFNLCLGKATTKVVELLWYTNPVKNEGLYTSPKPGFIQLLDIDYYMKKAPLVFKQYTKDSVIEYDLLKDHLPKDMKFIAECKTLPSAYRSPWHDYEELKRKGNRRDFISNIWATPLGASETPFDHVMLNEIKAKDICKPDFKGELHFDFYSNGQLNLETITFNQCHGRLKWWGGLPFGRPDQRHNYVLAIDPSYGLGSANSAMVIVDVNTNEQVGSWVDTSTKPERLADTAVALAHWVGGIQDTFIIWDTGGGCGSMFTDRLLYHRYPAIYTQRREDSKTRKRTQKWGWFGHGKAKDALLGELGVALSGGLLKTDDYKALIIHDEELISELFDYVFRESGTGTVVSKKADLTTGALERHGDRVIAAGLCVVGAKEQPIGRIENAQRPPINSFQSRFNAVNEEIERNNFAQRKYLF